MRINEKSKCENANTTLEEIQENTENIPGMKQQRNQVCSKEQPFREQTN